MEIVFVDTNIVIDLLSKRPDFFEEAQELFTLADREEISLCISSLTFATTHYLLSKHYKKEDTRKLLSKFKVLVTILPLDDKVIELALVSDFNDFEDAIQHTIAVEHGSTVIITRNKKDFKQSKLPVLTAREYLSR